MNFFFKLFNIIFLIYIEEDIMKHIQREFHTHIQYICISSRSPESHVMSSTSHSSRIFIQIILKKVINKKTFFLEDIAGKSFTNI